MAFGQQSGPPASAKQVQELLSLLQEAGHTDFRDARGPMGFTQRQAGGKFTRDEATDFIEQLQNESTEQIEQIEQIAPATKASTPNAPTPSAPSTSSSTARPKASAKARPSAAEQALGKFSTEQLAAELQRRGWIVVEP
jgi:hypothetical protein